MKRSVLLTLLAVGTVAGVAQSGGTATKPTLNAPRTHAPGSFDLILDHPTANPTVENARQAAFWTEDFSGGSVPAGWTNEDNLTPSGTPNVTFVWSNDPGDVGDAALGYTPSSVFGASSAGNGYLWANSDRGLSAAPASDHLTQLTTTAIDCSTQPSVLLVMESLVGVFDYDANTNVRVQVSIDGSSWTTFIPFPCLVTGAPAPPCERWSANPQFVALDITSVAANQATVYLRFEWLGGWEYFWAIDDISLSEVPDYEMVTDFGVLSHTGFGEEFGRIPQAQLNPTFNLGAQVHNFGLNAQDNVTVYAEVRDASSTLMFSASENLGTIAPGDTGFMNQFPTLPAMPEGVYTGTFWWNSDQASSESDLTNDTIIRTFSVDDDVYSLDGLGIHVGGETITSLGTNSFTNGEDEAFFMNCYPIRVTTNVYGLDILLNNTTVEGGLMIGSIHDSTTVMVDADLSQPLIEVDHVVSAGDVSAGMVHIAFPGGLELAPGAYYAAVQLFSNAGTNTIRIVDDATVPQPGVSAAIYLPQEADPGPYTNGNAFAIRMLLDPAASVTENEMPGVDVFPNPTTDIVNVVVAENKPVEMRVMNALGEVVMQDRFTTRTIIDMKEFSSGMYSIHLTDGQTSTTRVVARH